MVAKNFAGEPVEARAALGETLGTERSFAAPRTLIIAVAAFLPCALLALGNGSPEAGLLDACPLQRDNNPISVCGPLLFPGAFLPSLAIQPKLPDRSR